MNTNNDYTNSQGDENHTDKYTTQRTRIDGLVLYSTQKTANTYNWGYSEKAPLKRSKSPKGFNGFSDKQNEEIELSVYKLGIDYGFDNCKWFVLTFDNNVSDEALINLLTNFNSFHKSIKYVFNKAYKKHCFDPYIIIYGLRERTSYNRKIPCLDANILCADKDKDGNQLFNELILTNEIYLAASKQAKEKIDIPVDYYYYFPQNTLENYKQLANYLKNQVDVDLLKRFQKSEHALLLLNTYVYIPTSLKNTFSSIKNKYINSSVSEHKKFLQENFSDVADIVGSNSSSKFTAQLKDSSEESINNFDDRYKQAYQSKHFKKTIPISSHKVINDIYEVSSSFVSFASTISWMSSFALPKYKIPLLPLKKLPLGTPGEIPMHLPIKPIRQKALFN